MDIFDYLKKDHDKVNGLFKQFKKAPSKRKADIAQLIADELIAHAKSEQEIFYKALEKHPQSKDKAIHGRKEHKEIEDQIKKFDLKKHDSQLTSHLEHLEKLVSHHVKEEEGTIFKLAKTVLSCEQTYALKELMHDLKHQVLLKRQN